MKTARTTEMWQTHKVSKFCHKMATIDLTQGCHKPSICRGKKNAVSGKHHRAKHNKTMYACRGWNFQPHSPSLPYSPISGALEKGEGLEAELIPDGQWLNQSHLHNKASIKIPKVWGLEVVRMVTTWRCWDSSTLGEEMEAPYPSPQALPMYLFYSALSALYTCTINW